jgi:hypothetical protein
MSIHAVDDRAKAAGHSHVHVSPHVVWLAGGFGLAFALPFLLTDVIGLNRDVFYGIYALGVVGLFAAWSRSTGYDLGAAVHRHWPWAVGLGVVCGALLAVMVVRTEEATARPDGLALAGSLAWRGVLYGAVDGLLLSSFPILVVFAAFAGGASSRRRRGTIAIGAVALLASLVMTAVYHLGYSDFRSEKVRKPLVGDTMWSVPTLVTLNPIGAPIAHIGLHVSAVLHSSETDTFLPPHE